MECWLDNQGRFSPRLASNELPWKKCWDAFLVYPLDPPRNNRSMCLYMRDEPIEVGMRAYVDWVFHVKYADILSRWALSQTTGLARERTLIVCFEDFVSKEKHEAAKQKTVNFFFNSSTGLTERESEKGRHEVFDYHGPHATSHDPRTRQLLIETIMTIDRTCFNGEIAWLDSILPC